jgi:hypothetical protein
MVGGRLWPREGPYRLMGLGWGYEKLVVLLEAGKAETNLVLNYFANWCFFTWCVIWTRLWDVEEQCMLMGTRTSLYMMQRPAATASSRRGVIRAVISCYRQASPRVWCDKMLHVHSSAVSACRMRVDWPAIPGDWRRRGGWSMCLSRNWPLRSRYFAQFGLHTISNPRGGPF